MENNREIEILILKKFDQKILAEEQKSLEEWRAKSSNELIYRQYQQIWHLSNSLSDWNEFGADKAMVKVKKKISISSARKKYKLYLQIAASFIFLVSIGISILIVNPDFLSTSNNNTRWFLEDGSEVVLAKGASIGFLDGFNKFERRINLNGEAYFNIFPDKYKPFIVELEDTEIEVVGTSFLANSETNSVFVNHGTVILRDSNDPGNMLSLTAGEKASFKEEKLSKLKFKVDWLQKEIELENMPVLSLLRELKILFPNSIKINAREVDKDCRITSKFNNTSLLEVINELKLIFNLEYDQTPNYIYIKSLSCE